MSENFEEESDSFIMRFLAQLLAYGEHSVSDSCIYILILIHLIESVSFQT